MARKPKDPTTPPTLTVVRRPKAGAPQPPADPLAPAVVPPEDDAPVAPLTDEDRDAMASLSDEDRASILTAMHAGRELVALKAYRDAVPMRPEVPSARAAVRAILLASIEASGGAPVVATPVLVDDSGGEDDSEKVVAPPAKRTGKVVLREVSVDRQVTLTDAEFTSYAIELAHLDVQFREMESEHAGVRKKMRDDANTLKGTRSRLSGIIEKREEARPCTLVHEADYDMGIVREIEKRSGDVLNTRPLAPEEMQMPLFVPPAVVEPTSPTGQDVGRTFESIAGGQDEDLRERASALIANSNRIGAVSLVREELDCGLSEAKAWLEEHVDRPNEAADAASSADVEDEDDGAHD